MFSTCPGPGRQRAGHRSAPRAGTPRGRRPTSRTEGWSRPQRSSPTAEVVPDRRGRPRRQRLSRTAEVVPDRRGRLFAERVLGRVGRRPGTWWAPRPSKPTRGRFAPWRVRFPSASAAPPPLPQLRCPTYAHGARRQARRLTPSGREELGQPPAPRTPSPPTPPARARHEKLGMTPALGPPRAFRRSPTRGGREKLGWLPASHWSSATRRGRPGQRPAGSAAGAAGRIRARRGRPDQHRRGRPDPRRGAAGRVSARRRARRSRRRTCGGSRRASASATASAPLTPRSTRSGPGPTA
jgi:hypothetical protein